MDSIGIFEKNAQKPEEGFQTGYQPFIDPSYAFEPTTSTGIGQYHGSYPMMPFVRILPNVK